jgi:hypothetical protein
MAARAGIAPSSVHKIWAAHGLKARLDCCEIVLGCHMLDDMGEHVADLFEDGRAGRGVERLEWDWSWVPRCAGRSRPRYPVPARSGLTRCHAVAALTSGPSGGAVRNANNTTRK